MPGADDIRAALQMLLERAREDDALDVHVQNKGTAGDPGEPGTPGWELVFTPNADDLAP